MHRLFSFDCMKDIHYDNNGVWNLPYLLKLHTWTQFCRYCGVMLETKRKEWDQIYSIKCDSHINFTTLEALKLIPHMQLYPRLLSSKMYFIAHIPIAYIFNRKCWIDGLTNRGFNVREGIYFENDVACKLTIALCFSLCWYAPVM